MSIENDGLKENIIRVARTIGGEARIGWLRLTGMLDDDAESYLVSAEDEYGSAEPPEAPAMPAEPQDRLDGLVVELTGRRRTPDEIAGDAAFAAMSKEQKAACLGVAHLTRKTIVPGVPRPPEAAQPASPQWLD